MRKAVRVVEDRKLEIFVILQHLGDFYEEIFPVRTGGCQLVLEVLSEKSAQLSFTSGVKRERFT